MNTLQLTALKLDEIYKTKSAHFLIPPFMSKVVIVTI
jgi:hypothetical protein